MRIGIAGAGGIGSNVAMLLVRAGFTKFTIVDFDYLEQSNLNRQFYFEDQLGKSKVESLKINLERISTVSLPSVFTLHDISLLALEAIVTSSK